MFSDLMIIEFTEEMSDMVKEHKVAMFNKNIVTEEEVIKSIQEGGYDPRYVVMTRQQYENLCK